MVNNEVSQLKKRESHWLSLFSFKGIIFGDKIHQGSRREILNRLQFLQIFIALHVW
jgi:hypothetical protein